MFQIGLLMRCHNYDNVFATPFKDLKSINELNSDISMQEYTFINRITIFEVYLNFRRSIDQDEEKLLNLSILRFGNNYN